MIVIGAHLDISNAYPLFVMRYKNNLEYGQQTLDR